MTKLFLFILLTILSAGSHTVSAFDLLQQDQAQNDTTYIRQLISESKAAINQGQFNIAYYKLRKAARHSDLINYMPGRALAASSLAEAYLQQQKLDSASIVLNHAIQNYPESIYLYEFHNLLGVAFGYKNENAKALDQFKKALELVHRIPESEQARENSGIQQNMASILLREGNRAEAFKYYLNAVRFSEITRDTLYWVTTLNNVGDSYNSIDDNEKASFYLEKAKELAEIKNLKNEQYRINLNLGNTRSEQERYDEALQYYTAALGLLKEIRPGTPPVQILYNLGKLNRALGRYTKAEKNYRASLQYSEELNIPQGLYYNHYGLGSIFYKMNKYEKAIFHLEYALTIAEQLQDVPFIQEIRKLLYQVYRDAGQFENAYLHLEKFHIASDSLFGIEKAQALANMENQLALDRQNEINRLLQEKQVNQERRLQFQLILIITAATIIILVLIILFLMRKRAIEREEINKHLQSQKEELEEINHAKNKLFSIVAHDLRSPLSSLQGILYLIKNKVLSNEDIQKFAQELDISVRQNVETMEDLLAWASGQLSGLKMELEPLHIHTIADDVLMKLSYAAERKNVELINKIEEASIALGDENALQLVLRNLVSNSIKFTPKNGRILLFDEYVQGQVKISVIDNGIGISAEDANKVFSHKSWTRKGTENEKGTGLGLNICKDFIEKMNGEIWFESESGEGTTFFFSLPAPLTKSSHSLLTVQ